MSPTRDQLEESARKALAEAKDPRKAAALAAAGTAAAAAGLGLKRLRDGDGRTADSGAYRLLAGEPVGAGIKRVAAARVDDAIRQLRGETDQEPAEAVHEARKDIKKIRSALRLVRDEIGNDVWRRENDHYRDIARTLSSFRDAEIRVEALAALAERFGFSARDASKALREQLEEEKQAAEGDGSLERAMTTAGAALAAGRTRMASMSLDGDGWDRIAPGLHRSYRRGRRRMRAVEEEANVTNLHELRKRAKDLWYQLRLIRDADNALIGQLADHAHDLSDHLGDDHDLALLREEVRARDAAFASPEGQRHLLELIDKRQGELQFAATSLGERIYGDKPKKFAKGLEKRWEAWREREPVAA